MVATYARRQAGNNDSTLVYYNISEKDLKFTFDIVTSVIGKEILSMKLHSFKVFIYDLPSKFNQDLLHGAQNNLYNTMCFDLESNSGKGHHVLDTGAYQVSNTHQFSTEVNFHRTLQNKTYLLTNDPKEADLFYVPFYAGLGCFCKWNDTQTSSTLNEEMWQRMESDYTYLRDGKPHIMALAKVEQVQK